MIKRRQGLNSRSLRGLSKHGGTKRRVWGKIYLGIDAETLEVRAIKITGSQIGDATVLPDLLGYIPEDDRIGSVTAGGAYDTRKC